VFYKFVIEIFLYFIGYIFKMFKFRNIHFENQIEQYAKLIHGLMLDYTLMSIHEDELMGLKCCVFFVFRFIFLNWKSRFRIDFQFKVFYRRFLILLIMILIFKIIKNFFD
jgi:Na+/glutamate symporter